MSEKKVEIEGAGEVSTENKEIAMLIAVLALVLAIAELLGSAAQVKSVQANIEASNLWSFYQAKAIRSTTLETAVQQMEADMPTVTDHKQKEAREALITKWKGTIARYENDPASKEGREQIKERAKHAEHERDVYEVKHQRFELAIGAFHIAIVLASAVIISGVVPLIYVSGLLGIFGLLNLLGGWIT
jgi:Mn2+/Fe2+ NRAMP family transporter